MKKSILILLIPFCLQAFAQEKKDEPMQGFKKENLFSGGSVNVGFSNYYTALGATPQLGYSFTNWLDAGVNFNFNYISQRDIIDRGDKLRQTTYGPGAFVRLFPISMIFATTQYEYNFIKQNYIPVSSSNLPNEKSTLSAGSLLVGGGYAGGRQKGNNTYYFISVMWDISGNENSPYIDELGRSNPVIRAGYNIGLFQGKFRRR